MSTYLFRAASLCSRWGFGDGGMLDTDEFNFRLFLGDGIWVSDHLPLIAAVRKHLVPLLDSRVVIEEIDTHHNPIRATKETCRFVDKKIEIELSFDQIWLAFEEAYPEDAAECGKVMTKPTDEDFC